MKTKAMRSVVLAVAAVATLCGVLWATTWGTKTVTCPVCHEKNEFGVIASYGSYIYRWPSRFQQVYWPMTDGMSVYTCKKCNYSAFMWDFETIPVEKLETVRRVLDGTKITGTHEHYYEIPMSVRLAIAAKVYSAIGEDDEFWCHFYRVQGYHLAYEKKPTEADAARVKARDLARKMLDDSANASRRKELLIIAAAMEHFLRDDGAAKTDLDSAAKVAYHDEKKSAEENAEINTNINAFIGEYLKAIAANKVPKDDGSEREEKD